MQLEVIKYRLYPENNPIGYAVGFNVKLINEEGFTIYKNKQIVRGGN